MSITEIYIYPMDLHGLVNETVTQNADGSYTIIYDDTLSPSGRREAVNHALKHIYNNDFERTSSASEAELKAHERT